jgi:2-polyprenyl-3-methyl-5-hydroxy-6-metoxy-1,4-benzoquinol methylase
VPKPLSPSLGNDRADAARRAVRAPAYENPRPELRPRIPAAATSILDLGCSSGALGEALKDRPRTAGAPQPARVVGIEVDPAYAEAAKLRLDHVIVGNLETEEVWAAAAGQGPFDCLIAADVLEHLIDPWTALSRYASLLAPGGTAAVSLPNVRHWETIWQLGVRGVWPRRDSGIFDRDHLRWFTAADAISLLEQARLEVQAVDRIVRVRREPSGWDRPARALLRTPLRPFVTFQLVLAGRRP